jgi:hypothetical protein
MKVGDIALMQGYGLVKITELEYNEKPITKRVKVGFLRYKDEETGEVEKTLRKVWWCAIGDEWKNKQHSSTWSFNYDWDDMINRAKLVIKQAETIKNS